MPHISTSPSARIIPFNGISNPEDLRIGTVVWLKAAEGAVTVAMVVPPKAFGHPCIIVDIESDGQHLTVCMVTSIKAAPENERRLRIERQGGHVPILPNAYYTSMPADRVELTRGVKLRKNSWVIVKHTYTIPVGWLSTFDRNYPANHFMLTKSSIINLRHWCRLPAMLEPRSSHPASDLGTEPEPPRFVDATTSTIIDDEEAVQLPKSMIDPPQPHANVARILATRPRSASIGGHARVPACDETSPLLPKQTTYLVRQASGSTTRGVLRSGVRANYRDRADRHHIGDAQSLSDEEAATSQRRLGPSTTLHIKKAFAALWLCLPARRTILKSLSIIRCICIVAGTFGLVGYGAYLVIHKIIVTVMAGAHALARGASSVAAGLATTWRVVSQIWKSVASIFATSGKSVIEMLREMMKRAKIVIAAMKA